MYTLQGIITKLADNSNRQFDNLGYIAKNVSNQQTVGYKKERFEEYMRENGTLTGTVMTDHSVGNISFTDNELDIAINGAGLIPVTNKKGELTYTREGNFKINSKGYLVTQDNCLIGEGIKVPVNYHRIKINSNGEVLVKEKFESNYKSIGDIPLVTFNNLSGLKSVEGNKFVATKESGQAYYVDNPDYIKQKHLERANVDMFETVEEILRLNGSLISSSKLIKTVDEIYRQAINLKQ